MEVAKGGKVCLVVTHRPSLVEQRYGQKRNCGKLVVKNIFLCFKAVEFLSLTDLGKKEQDNKGKKRYSHFFCNTNIIWSKEVSSLRQSSEY